MNLELPSNEILLRQLQWRYAVKQFDRTRKIAQDDWETLEQTLILTPTSYGLQPFKFIVVTDETMKNALLPHAWNQSQVRDCSHLVVIAGKKVFTEADVQRYLDCVIERRNVTPDSQSDYAKTLLKFTKQLSEKELVEEWAARQVYIALGFLVCVAAMRGIDSCPMEGFAPSGVDAILNLNEQNLTAVVLCPLGYRSDDDWLGKLPKVRLPKDELIEHAK